MTDSLVSASSVRVLLADDDPGIRASFARSLRGKKYRVDLAAEGSGALRLARENHYSIFVMDFDMPGQAGVELVRQLRALQPHASLIVITGDPEYAIESTKQKGVFMVISKPWEHDTLLTILDAASRRVERVASGERGVVRAGPSALVRAALGRRIG